MKCYKPRDPSALIFYKNYFKKLLTTLRISDILFACGIFNKDTDQ